MDLYSKYGRCIIPKGAILYRGHKNNNITDVMFFATNYITANSFNFGGNVQLWKVKKKVEVLFLLKSLDKRAFSKSNLPDLYYEIYPNELNRNLDILQIKQDHVRRNPFAAELHQKFNIGGWFTPVEDKEPLEVCLFNKEKIMAHIELSAITKGKSELYFYESLRKFEIHPPEEFYSNSREAIKAETFWPDEGKDPYLLHRKKIRSWVKDHIEKGETKQKAREYYFDLRSKLKI